MGTYGVLTSFVVCVSVSVCVCVCVCVCGFHPPSPSLYHTHPHQWRQMHCMDIHMTVYPELGFDLCNRHCWSSGTSEYSRSLTRRGSWSEPRLPDCEPPSTTAHHCQRLPLLLLCVCVCVCVCVCSYRLCEVVYEKRRQFGKVLSCYLRDPNRRVSPSPHSVVRSFPHSPIRCSTRRSHTSTP